LDHLVRSSTTTTLTFPELGNGSDNFTVGAVTGYIADPDSGEVVVHGVAVYPTIAFSPASGVGGATGRGATLVPIPEDAVVGVVAIAAVGGVVLAVYRRRSGR
jgi:hypothetical protein